MFDECVPRLPQRPAFVDPSDRVSVIWCWRCPHDAGDVLHDFRVLRRHVVLFADVVAQVVKLDRSVLPRANSFPVLPANRLVIATPTVAVVPVEKLARLKELAALECLYDRNTVDVGGRLDTGEFGRQLRSAAKIKTGTVALGCEFFDESRRLALR